MAGAAPLCIGKGENRDSDHLLCYHCYCQIWTIIKHRVVKLGRGWPSWQANLRQTTIAHQQDRWPQLCPPAEPPPAASLSGSMQFIGVLSGDYSQTAGIGPGASKVWCHAGFLHGNRPCLAIIPSFARYFACPPACKLVRAFERPP